MGLYINNKSVSLKTSRCDDITLIIPKKKGLSEFDRVDGKATVAGFFVDENNIKYAVCVADASMRFGNVRWGPSGTNTSLPDYYDSASAINAKISATAIMNTIKNNYSLSSYNAFNDCYAKTITYKDKIYHGLLPNASEINMIFQKREQLDLKDESLPEYESNKLSTWTFGGYNRCWIAAEFTLNNAWRKASGGGFANATKTGKSGVVPIFEIPVED